VISPEIEALPSQVFQVFQVVAMVIKGHRAAHFVLRPDHKGHIGSPKGTVPFGRGPASSLMLSYYPLETPQEVF